MSMRSLEVKLRFPNEAYAGEETRIDFLVSKGRALLPARAFSLRPAPSAEGTHQPYALRIAQGESRRISGLYRFHERGKYRIAGVDVRCGHPFGIISLSRRFRLEHEMLIYPRIMPIEEMFERRKEGLALRDAQLRGHGGGLLNVRPFVPGDDKLERMMLKEFAHEEGQAIWLHFNPRCAVPHPLPATVKSLNWPFQSPHPSPTTAADSALGFCSARRDCGLHPAGRVTTSASSSTIFPKSRSDRWCRPAKPP